MASGFGGAIAGALIGALGGAGQGMRWSIEAQEKKDFEDLAAARAERLQLLSQTFQSGENRMTREAGAEQAKLQLASTEKLAGAQIASNKLLTEMQEAGATGRANIAAKSSEKIAGEENVARATLADKQMAVQLKIALAGETGATTRNDAQIAASKELAEIQRAGEWKPMLVNRKDADGKPVQEYVLVNGDGDKKELPLDENTGKPLNPVIASTDTDKGRDYKLLLTEGHDKDKAADLIWGSAAAGGTPESRAVAIYKSLNESSTGGVKPLDEEAQLRNWRIAQLMAGVTDLTAVVPEEEAAASAAATFKPEAIAKIKAMNDAQLRAAVAAKAGASEAEKAQMKAAILQAGKDPAAYGL